MTEDSNLGPVRGEQPCKQGREGLRTPGQSRQDPERQSLPRAAEDAAAQGEAVTGRKASHPHTHPHRHTHMHTCPCRHTHAQVFTY